MARDRAIGVALVIGAVVGVIIYGALMFAFDNVKVFDTTVPVFVLKITAFVAILAILGVLGWIGYVMATTPPPVPLEPEPTPSAKAESATSQSVSSEKKM